ncbi:hypothetical protein [Peribacillus sp. NPDC058075]|uniref:hypothetical protein n=1 Tax=unclassified Peribacillus TaxID=2675266 RepID=UPI0036DE7371
MSDPGPCTIDYEKVMKQMRLTWELWKYDFVIIPKGYEEKARQLNEAGYKTIELESRSYKIRTVD